MALNLKDLNLVTLNHVLHDEESIQQAVRATGGHPASLRMIIERCQELGLEPAEQLQKAIDYEGPIFKRLTHRIV
jgi:hypothetical protein